MKLAFKASDQALAMDEPHQEAFLSGLCQSHLMEFLWQLKGGVAQLMIFISFLWL